MTPQDQIETLCTLADSQGWGLLRERLERETAADMEELLAAHDPRRIGQLQGRIALRREVAELPERMIATLKNK